MSLMSLKSGTCLSLLGSAPFFVPVLPKSVCTMLSLVPSSPPLRICRLSMGVMKFTIFSWTM